MVDFEKLGVFYLGREYDLETRELRDDLVLYDSKDLVTHAVCVGMTGSGKTGLCVGILEEAALDGIPSLVVDPKGDLSNLLLTFPDLEAKDFLPWVNQEEARKKDLSVEEYAEKQASLWKKGLADWGQDGARIARLKEGADFTVYTPGSSAGFQVSILKSFAAPEKVILEDPDLLRERINTTVTSLLNLLDIEADPIQSREHILLSSILEMTWKKGEDLDLARLIESIQAPPVSRIGVFDLESFYASRDRFDLAMKINNLLAAPGFQSWLEGEALDIGRMLYTNEGKPRVSIFSIAHLNDNERMFFVSLLLTQLLGWTRTQSGTSSLRALFYMDEIFGYFPPVANPPSKEPLLTLLKQARAFGVGIILATQNPVDLDYKGLSNAGTWFLGRLQTERDKERVLDGLEGVGSSAGGRFDRRKVEKILSSLGKRVFLMNNVHEDEPAVFHTRWVMSYLRGPLTRNQIKALMDPVKAARPQTAEAGGEIAGGELLPGKDGSEKPLLPPGVPQFFIPAGRNAPAEGVLFYEPMILGIGRLYYADAKAGITAEEKISMIAEQSPKIDWSEAQRVELFEESLEKYPEIVEALYGEIPGEAASPASYTTWAKEYRDWLYRSQMLELLRSPSLGLVSSPGEEEKDFRIRLQQVAREKRDELVERIREKYAARITKLEDRIRRAEHALGREKEQAKQQKMQTMISFGATLFSSMLGRKKVSRSTLGRATTTARQAGRIFKEGKDIERAQENVEALRQQQQNLQKRLEEEAEEIRVTIDPLTEKLEIYVVKPKKMDIAVSTMALVWTPYYRGERGGLERAW